MERVACLGTSAEVDCVPPLGYEYGSTVPGLIYCLPPAANRLELQTSVHQNFVHGPPYKIIQWMSVTFLTLGL